MRIPITASLLAIVLFACSSPMDSGRDAAAPDASAVDWGLRHARAAKLLVDAGPILGIGEPDPVFLRQPSAPTSSVPTTSVPTSTTTTGAPATTTSVTTTSPPATTSTTTTTVVVTTAPPATTTTTTTTVVVTTTAPPPTTTTTAPPGGFSASAEAEFASLINSLRSGAGVGALSRDGGLDAYARDWAQHMAEQGDLTHSNIAGLLGPWSTVGENIAYGGSVSQMFGDLDASSGHHANMVNGSFTHLGVGVWIDGSGLIWTTHVFAG